MSVTITITVTHLGNPITGTITLDQLDEDRYETIAENAYQNRVGETGLTAQQKLRKLGIQCAKEMKLWSDRYEENVLKVSLSNEGGFDEP